MKVRIAINGLGRIGRMVLRHALSHPNLEVVAVNDLVPASNLAYLLKFDSTHGRFEGEVKAEDHSIIVDGHHIEVLGEKEPEKLPWKRLKVDYVVEATGQYTKLEEARRHILAGARRVVITAPAKGDVPTFVMGVNHKKYNPEKDTVVSNASCTTNCLAPLVKILSDRFGIEEGLMTTIHAMTASQPTVDGASKKDWRGGRSAAQNIIPASTGAATAVELCVPEIKGKLTGMAFRVPVADVSVVDLTVRLKQATSYEEICKIFKEESEGAYKGIIQYSDGEVVSSDFIGSSYSSIFDAGAGIELNKHFFKIVAWYDNEWGYASRIVDLLDYMSNQEKGGTIVNFTREALVETVITPKEGYKLVVRNSKGSGQEELFVDSLELVSFSGNCFYRSMEKPKCFLVPVSDYEILEVRETKMILKSTTVDRGTKIAGGSRNAREAKSEEANLSIVEEKEEFKVDKKKDKKRNRKKRGKSELEEVESMEGSMALEEEKTERKVEKPSLIPPPTTLISETIARYKLPPLSHEENGEQRRNAVIEIEAEAAETEDELPF